MLKIGSKMGNNDLQKGADVVVDAENSGHLHNFPVHKCDAYSI